MWRISVLALGFCLVTRPGSAQGTGDPPDFAVHAGVTYARVADAEFERVGALSGQDLFSPIEERGSRADFAVFVSQRLAGTVDGVRAYATIGTGLRRPGETLLLGGSAGISRTLVTAGLATATVDEGVQPVPDQIFRVGADRTLFARLQRTRDWGFFIAVSFAVVQ